MRRPNPPLSARQLSILAFIRHYYAEHGYPPTVREIASGVGLRSTASTSAHLGALVRDGKLEQRHDGGRAYFPVEWETITTMGGVPVRRRIPTEEQ